MQAVHGRRGRPTVTGVIAGSPIGDIRCAMGKHLDPDGVGVVQAGRVTTR